MTRAEIESWLADYEFEDDWGGVIQTNHGNDEWPRRVAVLRWLRGRHAAEIKAAVAARTEEIIAEAESAALLIEGVGGRIQASVLRNFGGQIRAKFLPAKEADHAKP